MTKTIDIIIGGFDDGRTPSVQQYDTNSRRLLCRLWEKPGVPYTMSENAVVGVIFKWRKAEPAGEYKTEIVDQSTVLVTIPGDATQVSGAVFMQLVFHQDGGVMRSPELCFMTLESLAAGEEGIENPELLFDKLIEEANAATDRANDAADALENISAMATTLPAGREATAEVIDTEDGKLIVIGVPRGEKGEKGDKGDTGDGENNVTPVTSVNDVMPQEDGNVELKLSDMIFDDPEEDLGDDSITIVLPVVVDEAENAKKLGGVPAEGYATKADLENIDIPTGGANVAYNLLDNSNFEIAQAGYNGYHGASLYAADRWISSPDSVLTVNGEIKTFAAGEGYSMANQVLWRDGRDKGKTYTAAIELSNGTLRVASGTSPANEVSVETVVAGVWFDNNCSLLILKQPNGNFSVRLNAHAAGASCSFKHIRMFEGIYTAETLPPYVPKGYAAELLECQRYFFPLNPSAIGIGNINQSGSAFYAPIILPTAMRIQPTVVTANKNYTLTNNGTQIDVTNADLTVNYYKGNMVQLAMSVTGKGFNGSIISKIWGGSGNSYVHLSADL